MCHTCVRVVEAVASQVAQVLVAFTLHAQMGGLTVWSACACAVVSQGAPAAGRGLVPRWNVF